MRNVQGIGKRKKTAVRYLQCKEEDRSGIRI